MLWRCYSHQRWSLDRQGSWRIPWGYAWNLTINIAFAMTNACMWMHRVPRWKTWRRRWSSGTFDFAAIVYSSCCIGRIGYRVGGTNAGSDAKQNNEEKKTLRKFQRPMYLYSAVDVHSPIEWTTNLSFQTVSQLFIKYGGKNVLLEPLVMSSPTNIHTSAKVLLERGM